ncbi:hypothetical protein CEXT_243841 [Caerostris extrusa]|uniref:Uncharacterized protein n=1 Tax=Caerostris extrusa TaxID=172846 RepID=A0AAV4TDY4_CAEEX|nr:hypothetical protein CEXT_243841 [Caerostris extrusa]
MDFKRSFGLCRVSSIVSRWALSWRVVLEFQPKQSGQSHIVSYVELLDETVVQSDVTCHAHLPVKRVLGHSGKGLWDRYSSSTLNITGCSTESRSVKLLWSKRIT